MFFIPRILETKIYNFYNFEIKNEKVSLDGFFGIFFMFFKNPNSLLNGSRQIFGRLYVSKKREKYKYFEINLNGAIVKKVLCQRFFVLKSKKRTGELFFNF